MDELTEFEIKAYNNFLETVGLPKPISEPWDQDQVEDFNAAPPARQKLMLFEWGYDKAHEAIAKFYFPALVHPDEEYRRAEEYRQEKRAELKQVREEKKQTVEFWLLVGGALIALAGFLQSCGLL